MKDTNFKLHELDTVVWEKRSRNDMVETSPYAYSRYRIYKRVEKHKTSYIVTVETARRSELNKSNINWELLEGSLPFPTIMKAKFFLADHVTGYDISSNRIEKCRLSIHKFRVNTFTRGKFLGFLIAASKIFVIVIYLIGTLELLSFVLKVLEAYGMDINNSWFSDWSFILYWFFVIIAYGPPIWLSQLKKKQ